MNPAQQSPAPDTNHDEDVEQHLYAKRKKIFTREVHGLFARLRTVAMVLLLGGYYGAAWVNWEGHQALLFDLPNRKFVVFSLTFWPQDFFYLAVLLIVAALALFFFTAVAGRLWCGYACPQTVWTEIFMWIERKVEGSRNQQLKLEKQGWGWRKFRVKFLKHFLWAMFALWTGFTFVGYFTPIRELWDSVLTLSTGPWETFWIIFYGFATWGNAGFMREQVCTYMCPYARFQSAMFDKDTLIISYDEKRGNPRGSRSKKADPGELGLGDCIDCGLCVQVCPTGIDIRDGLQYECIGCAACIDVCDEVMGKMGYAPGLVKYTTHNAMTTGETHVLRPRIFVYASVIVLLAVALVWAMATRVPLELDVIRDRNSLYKESYDGTIENVYTLKLINMDQKAHRYSLKVSGIEGAKLELRKPLIRVPAGEVLNLPVSVSADPYSLKLRSSPIRFELQAEDNPELSVVEDARFLGPGPQ